VLLFVGIVSGINGVAILSQTQTCESLVRVEAAFEDATGWRAEPPVRLELIEARFAWRRALEWRVVDHRVTRASAVA
jgi:hypothetical protein